uniref:Uncharacterized protein n=1 Tax=Rhodosorus marinus TaxID=101924 RepID=A0A7S2ZYG0_9RHOD|mmetsp:Transcript_3523/g.16062  ORF Transcript_3523/g.16062 Transcript_3523/m.16062 type:complete len:113 (+) Transcript_3523:568-906(+)
MSCGRAKVEISRWQSSLLGSAQVKHFVYGCAMHPTSYFFGVVWYHVRQSLSNEALQMSPEKVLVRDLDLSLWIRNECVRASFQQSPPMKKSHHGRCCCHETHTLLLAVWGGS